MAIYLFYICIVPHRFLCYTNHNEERIPDQNERQEEIQRDAPFSVKL